MANHSYWRIVPTAANGGANLTIDEIQMRSTSGGADLCVGGTATAQNYLSTNYPANAFDNTVNTAWQSTGLGWIQYYFATAVNIVEYTISIRGAGFEAYVNQAPKNWTFAWSDNGSSWTTVDTQTNQTAWAAGETRTFTLAVVPVTIEGTFSVTEASDVADITGTVIANINGVIAITENSDSIAFIGTIIPLFVTSTRKSYSYLDIYNLALARIGISRHCDTSTEILRLFYEFTLEKTLEEFPWNFATKFIPLTVYSAWTGDAPENWKYVYEYPADCVFARRVWSGQYPDTNATRVPFKIVDNGIGTAPVILCNSENAVLEYTFVVKEISNVVIMYEYDAGSAYCFTYETEWTKTLIWAGTFDGSVGHRMDAHDGGLVVAIDVFWTDIATVKACVSTDYGYTWGEPFTIGVYGNSGAICDVDISPDGATFVIAHGGAYGTYDVTVDEFNSTSLAKTTLGTAVYDDCNNEVSVSTSGIGQYSVAGIVYDESSNQVTKVYGSDAGLYNVSTVGFPALGSSTTTRIMVDTLDYEQIIIHRNGVLINTYTNNGTRSGVYRKFSVRTDGLGNWIITGITSKYGVVPTYHGFFESRDDGLTWNFYAQEYITENRPDWGGDINGQKAVIGKLTPQVFGVTQTGTFQLGTYSGGAYTWENLPTISVIGTPTPPILELKLVNRS